MELWIQIYKFVQRKLCNIIKSTPHPRIYPPPPFCDYVKCLLLLEYTPFKHLCEALPESTIPLRICPLFPHLYMRPSQNLPLPPRIYPPFEHLRSISLPEYTRLLYKATLLESTLPLFSQLYATLL